MAVLQATEMYSTMPKYSLRKELDNQQQQQEIPYYKINSSKTNIIRSTKPQYRNSVLNSNAKRKILFIDIHMVWYISMFQLLMWKLILLV